MIQLTKAKVDAGALDNYNPERYDAVWDNGNVTLYPLTWWDNESYAKYQSQD